MARPSIAKLQTDIEALRHNAELLRNAADSAKQETLDVSAECVALKSKIVALTAENEELREWYAAALATINELKAAPAAPRAKPLVTRPVYEFDPTIPGDFARASVLAKANNGSVRRVS